MRRVGILGGLLLTIATAVGAQSAKHSVLLVVSGDDTVKSRVESFVRRELRELPNVELVPKQPEYTISVFAAALRRESGRVDGYAVSFVFSKDPYLYHNVVIVSEEDLKRASEELVARFDTEFLGQF